MVRSIFLLQIFKLAFGGGGGGGVRHAINWKGEMSAFRQPSPPTSPSLGDARARFAKAFVFLSYSAGRGGGVWWIAAILKQFWRNCGVMNRLNFNRFREPNSPQHIQNGLLTIIAQWCEACFSFNLSNCPFWGCRCATIWHDEMQLFCNVSVPKSHGEVPAFRKWSPPRPPPLGNARARLANVSAADSVV